MSVATPGLQAGGNISPARVVIMSGEWTVTQASDGDTLPCGVSGPYTRYAPGTAWDDGYIAQSGDEVPVFTNGEIASVEAGAAITGGNFVMANAAGRVIPATTGKYFVGEALESATTAASGTRIRVRIQPGILA